MLTLSLGSSALRGDVESAIHACCVVDQARKPFDLREALDECEFIRDLSTLIRDLLLGTGIMSVGGDYA